MQSNHQINESEIKYRTTTGKKNNKSRFSNMQKWHFWGDHFIWWVWELLIILKLIRNSDSEWSQFSQVCLNMSILVHTFRDWKMKKCDIAALRGKSPNLSEKLQKNGYFHFILVSWVAKFSMSSTLGESRIWYPYVADLEFKLF